MIYYIFGGSASGKSEYAEDLAVSCSKRKTDEASGAAGARSFEEELLYIATMKNDSSEAAARIEKHQMQRSGKGFALWEADSLETLAKAPSAGTILFDCLSNFTAGVLFSEKYIPLMLNLQLNQLKELAEEIVEQIRGLAEKCDDLIIVSDSVFSDGCVYEPLTELYIRLLGDVCRAVADLSDQVEEITFGLPYRLR